MRVQRPIHYLAKIMSDAKCFSALRRHDDAAILVQQNDQEQIAVYLFEECPTASDIGHMFARNTALKIFTLPILPGEVFENGATLPVKTLAMLDIFYPFKTYAYKIIADEVNVLPVILDWSNHQPRFHFSMPVDLLKLKTRTIEIDGFQWLIADFGARPPYDPKERFRRWKERYGDSGNGGRRTSQRRIPKKSPTYASKSYYAVLGLEVGASLEEIKAAYRQLARSLHPDVNASPAAKSEMQKVNEAYAILVKSTYILRK